MIAWHLRELVACPGLVWFTVGAEKILAPPWMCSHFALAPFCAVPHSGHLLEHLFSPAVGEWL